MLEITKNTTCIFYNEQEKPIQRMLDFDYLCKREIPSISSVVNPNRKGYLKVFWGKNEILIPVYASLSEAVEKHPESTVLVNFASQRPAFAVTKECIENHSEQIKLIHIMAEGVPENESRELIRLVNGTDITILGPSSVGMIKPAVLRIGNTCGSIENITNSKLFKEGSVGVITTSGGMLSELLNIVAQKTDGAYEGVSIGGDKFPVSTLLDHLKRLDNDPKVKMLVSLSEIGGTIEYEISEAVKKKEIKKPLVMWVMGTIADHLKTEVQFGHAGAKSGSKKESASEKNRILQEAGVFVPENFDDFGELIEKVWKDNGFKENNSEVVINKVPEDYDDLFKQNLVRKPSTIISSISDDRGEEPTYMKKPINEFAEKSIGYLINTLWFQGKLKEFAEEFIELCIKLSADHGPAVATAHNSIVTSRAGNNVVMSLISGLTTIGDRHGGAIDGTAYWLLDAVVNNKSAEEIISEHKKRGKLIMGIGHRFKTEQNPDKRVLILKKFIDKLNIKRNYLEKALEVEVETLKKKNKLILNLDGAIAASFLDILVASNYTSAEINHIVDTGALNAIFILSRSIGMIGHALDQKRLGQGLYWHNWDDILYI